MRRFHFLVSFASLSCGLVAAGACEDGRSSIDLAIRVPQGLLDEVTSMELIVSEGAHCDAATGRVTDEPDAAQRFPMDRSCASGAKWCKDISLEKDGVSRVFHVVGKTATEVAAEGCSEALVDQDPLRVDVALRRYIVPGCCNNGVVDGREQCDPGIQAATDCAGKPVPNGNSACFGTV
ncbi:MAG: hypothetical protein EXR75_02290, partial [Myxococcales bacterium]|nr:hypothetical protein [Myxococcales bacterium]